MESTKIIKHVDRLGRFKLPPEWLNAYDIKPNSLLKLTRGMARIVVEPVEHKCIFCLSTKNIHVFKDKFICNECAKNIAQNYKL